MLETDTQETDKQDTDTSNNDGTLIKTDDTDTSADTGTDTKADGGSEELIFGKYKDMEAATEAFKTLESDNGKLRRTKMPEAPEEYSWDFKDDEVLGEIIGDANLAEDPLLQRLSPVMKENNITQDQAQALVREYLAWDSEQVVDSEAEKAKLGADADDILQEVGSFVGRSFSKEGRKYLEQIATTAEGVEFIRNELMAVKTIPDGGDTTSGTGMSSADYFERASEIKKNNDLERNTAMRDKYEKLMDTGTALQLKGR